MRNQICVIESWMPVILKIFDDIDFMDVVYVGILEQFKSEDGMCYISDAELAIITGVNERSAQRRIKKLTDNGIISKETEVKKGVNGAGKTRAIKINYDFIYNMINTLPEEHLKEITDIQKRYSKNHSDDNSTQTQIQSKQSNQLEPLKQLKQQNHRNATKILKIVAELNDIVYDIL